MNIMKTFFLIIGILILLAGTIFLAIQIQDTTQPTGTVTTRADENTEPVPTEVPEGEELAANSTGASSTTPDEVIPTPTFGNSYLQPTPTLKVVVTATPTTVPITKLPEAGFFDVLPAVFVGGFVLLVAAFLF